jgi:inorganic pyrophosphatase
MGALTHAHTFWHHVQQLLETSEVVIDRPAGSCHPRYPDMVYPLDYGYLSGTRAADGDGIDVWVGGLSPPRLTAIVCTVDLAKRDAEIKVLVGCSPDDIAIVLAFHNQGSQAALTVLRAEQL